MIAPLQMAFAGVWDRFPKLKFYWAETMIGWLEYGLWQIDDHYDRYIGMIHDHWGLDRLSVNRANTSRNTATGVSCTIPWVSSDATASVPIN